MAERYKLELGRAIARRRNELGLTQKQLADKAHVEEVQTVSRWERGQNLPSNLDAVATALDWTLAEMVAGIEPPNRTVARQWGLVAPEAENHTGDLMGALKPASADLDSLSTKLDTIQQTLDALAEAVRAALPATAQTAGADELEPPGGDFARSESDDQPSQGQNPAGEHRREAGPQTNGAG